MLEVPRLNLQCSGLQHVVYQPIQEITRPKGKFKPTLPESWRGGDNCVNFNLIDNYGMMERIRD